MDLGKLQEALPYYEKVMKELVFQVILLAKQCVVGEINCKNTADCGVVAEFGRRRQNYWLFETVY